MMSRVLAYLLITFASKIKDTRIHLVNTAAAARFYARY